MCVCSSLQFYPVCPSGQPPPMSEIEIKAQNSFPDHGSVLTPDFFFFRFSVASHCQKAVCSYDLGVLP